ncbi:MAG: hypothetical protein QOG38_3389 [Hyphomicrobiales bacterium]|jgi:hypothetical protein|nr:hypothetical protein [Hyphomicrobiales bacterium]
MRALLFLLGIILIVIAVAYLLIPADALPTWMPGYEAGRTATRMKHGLAAGGVGILLFILGWFVGRR